MEILAMIVIYGLYISFFAFCLNVAWRLLKALESIAKSLEGMTADERTAKALSA